MLYCQRRKFFCCSCFLKIKGLGEISGGKKQFKGVLKDETAIRGQNQPCVVTVGFGFFMGFVNSNTNVDIIS